MDPTTRICRAKEKDHVEQEARRKFQKRWSKLNNSELQSAIYNPEKINDKLKEDLQLKDLCPFTYTGHGDSHFVSRDMYNELVGTCRCGRPRSEAHLIKCVQKEKSKLKKSTLDEASNSLPATSNGFIGWQQRKTEYQRWEQSMKYTSPVYDMPGHRIAAKPYNAIIIG